MEVLKTRVSLSRVNTLPSDIRSFVQCPRCYEAQSYPRIFADELAKVGECDAVQCDNCGEIYWVSGKSTDTRYGRYTIYHLPFV